MACLAAPRGQGGKTIPTPLPTLQMWDLELRVGIHATDTCGSTQTAFCPPGSAPSPLTSTTSPFVVDPLAWKATCSGLPCGAGGGGSALPLGGQALTCAYVVWWVVLGRTGGGQPASSGFFCQWPRQCRWPSSCGVAVEATTPVLFGPWCLPGHHPPNSKLACDVTGPLGWVP